MTNKACQCEYIDDNGSRCLKKNSLFEWYFDTDPDMYVVACSEHLTDLGYDGNNGEIFIHKCGLCRPSVENKVDPLYILVDCGDHFETRERR